MRCVYFFHIRSVKIPGISSTLRLASTDGTKSCLQWPRIETENNIPRPDASYRTDAFEHFQQREGREWGKQRETPPSPRLVKRSRASVTPGECTVFVKNVIVTYGVVHPLWRKKKRPRAPQFEAVLLHRCARKQIQHSVTSSSSSSPSSPRTSSSSYLVVPSRVLFLSYFRAHTVYARPGATLFSTHVWYVCVCATDVR